MVGKLGGGNVPQDGCQNSGAHQQQAAGGLAMNKFLKWRENFIEGLFPWGIKNAFFRGAF